MKTVFITGSTDGLGFAAARQLISEGHHVVVHARSRERASVFSRFGSCDMQIVVGDLSNAHETRSVAQQVNLVGRMDAVIHNAGVYNLSERGNTANDHARTLAINTLAPYMLTELIDRPKRLIYLTSALHQQGVGPLDDINWTHRPWDGGRAYAESKLYVTTLAAYLARLWPEVTTYSVNPGWVPTKMGGPSAPDDIDEGYLTQTWLAASDDDVANASGGYWYHKRQQKPAAATLDSDFQNQLVTKLAELTGIQLSSSRTSAGFRASRPEASATEH